ncbi:SDR family NAD(P)-dependent oxidoreductase [Nocardioides currus]|uniref:Short-chain dehydrogenase n=1 Tax=Nocardioides currus TaxID=2133958 RepID=A0A2R7Z2D3_9ACTN|nr:SDR family oxidoreductase [Nocardioides currus]PUA82805.1 short-chain dehydrogenase [Nocardioides currus]
MTTTLDRFRLDGRTAVVTGASSGLGAGFARALAQSGANIVIGARRCDQLRVTARAVEEAGGTVLWQHLDVADPGSCGSLASAAMDRFGSVDVLVNNAGVGSAVPALRETAEQFTAVMDVNLMGSYWMAQACARVMRPGSSIVNIASVLGIIPSYAPQAAYASSKAGVIGLTRDLAQQWSQRRGIRVNALAPGYFESELTASVPRDDLHRFIERRGIIHRLGEQHELDAALLFLASDASSYITGITLPVDGGMSTH